MDRHLNKLPLEVISLILSHLKTRDDYYQGTLISKHFYKSMVPRLWQTPMKLKSAEYAATPTVLLAKCLIMDRSRPHSFRTTPLGDFVRKIRFNETTLVDTMLLCLSHMPLLESLHIKNVLGVVDETMDHISLLCPRIKVFNLTCHEITDQTIVSLARHDLYALCLSECHLLTPNALAPIKNSGLVKLDFNECDWVNSRTAMDISYLSKLAKLRFQSCLDIDTDFIRRLLRKPTKDTISLPDLEELSINEFGPEVPVDGLVLTSFARAHPRLNTLVVTLYNINDTTLSALSSAVPFIFCLELHGPCQISSQALRSFIKNCPILCHLLLRQCRLPARCFPEVDNLYDRRHPVFVLSTVDLDRIRDNSHAHFTAEDDELHTSDEEQGWEERIQDDEARFMAEGN